MPFYKRDFSFKRGPKEWDAGEVLTEEPPKQRVTLPRPRPSLPTLPTLSRGGGGGKQLVGLKIGGSQIAAARVRNGETLELVQAARTPLDHGVVVNGELRDPEALAVALKAFFAEHKLPKRGVRLGIANNRIGVRTFEVTGIEDSKQLANAIRFRAQEVLPIPLEEAVLDYQVLSEGVTEDGQPLRRVLLVVAYRELVDRYVYACRKAGLQIVGIDLEAFALLRAVAAPHDAATGSERGALVAVSVGHDRSTFAVSDGRVCEFTRVLEWGGWALNVAIARALDMSPSEVEPIKRALSFSGAERGSGGLHRGAARDRAGRRQEAAADVRAGARLLAPVLPEPARIARHRRDRAHRRHRPPARPRRGARAADRRPGPRRRPAHPPQGLEEGARAASRSDRSRSPSASGSRTRCAPSTSSPATRPTKSFAAKRGVVFGGIGGAALATAVLASMMISAGGAASSKQAELDGAPAEIAAIPAAPVIDTLRGGRARGREGRACRRALRGARGPRRLGPRAPPDLARPARGRLADEAFGDGAGPDAARPRPADSGFTLTGATYSQNGVARFLSRLAVIPDLANVRLQSSQSQL